MCLYSVAKENTRIAEEGDRLVTSRFEYGQTGLASPAHDHRLTCLKDGTCLIARNLPDELQKRFGVGPEVSVTFVHGSHVLRQDRIPDAVRLPNGRSIKLDDLPPGVEFDVLPVAIRLPVMPTAEATELEPALVHA